MQQLNNTKAALLLNDLHTTYLLLGSNIGDRNAWLAFARNEVSGQIGSIEKASHVFETAPWGNIHQQSFLNQALIVNTELKPKEVLREIQKIEQSADRQRSQRWGPRTLDIDILLYENVVLKTGELTVPHPHMTTRRFVLAPLSEIAGDVIHPVMNKTISELLAECKDQSEVAILAEG